MAVDDRYPKPTETDNGTDSTDGDSPTAAASPAIARRSVIAAAAGIVAVAAATVVASRWRPASDDNPASASQPTTSASEPSTPSASEPSTTTSAEELGPLPPPKVTVAGRGVTGAGDVLATAAVNASCAFTVQVAVPAWTRVLRATVVVAKPGSISGAYDPANPPDNAAMRSENQLVASDPLTNATAGTHDLPVAFQASEPGTYPVFYLSQILSAPDPGQPAPETNSGATIHDTSAELGNIIVS